MSEVISREVGEDGSVVTHGRSGPDSLFGVGGTDWMYGWGSYDELYGRGGTDYLYGGAGWDTLDGGNGNDYLFAHEETDDPSAYGSDTVVGGSGRDEVSYVHARSGVFVDLFAGYADEFNSNGGRHRDTLDSIEGASGSWHNDTICGSNGANILQGFGGYDVIVGNNGDDVINGGAHGDYLESGNGHNLFQYGSVADSEPNAHDTIGDFHRGLDKIDLGQIDANAGTSANNAFSFRGSAAFSGAGQVRYDHNWDGENWQTIIQVNVDDDLSADMEIDLRGWHELQSGDFVL